jgi:hypothetical protein
LNEEGRMKNVETSQTDREQTVLASSFLILHSSFA